MEFEEFFKLTERPFKANPEAKFFYRRSAFDDLCRRLSGEEGDLPMVLFLRGPAGVGKTAFIRRLPQALRATTRMAPILDSSFRLGGILEGTLNFLGLGFKCPPTAREESLLGIFQNAVSGLVEQGLGLVLAVDDARGAPEEALGDLLALTRLEPSWAGRATLMLAGPDEPDWPGPELPPEAVVVDLPPMLASETRLYLRHRLSAAGCDRELFAPAAIDAICFHGKGIPALINPLADRALITAWAAGRRQATGSDVIMAQVGIERGDAVDEAAARAAGAKKRGRAQAPGRAWRPLAAALGLVGAAAAALALGSASGTPSGPDAAPAEPPAAAAPELPVATATPAAPPGLPQEGAMALPSLPPGLAILPRGTLALVVDPDRGLGRLWQGGSAGAGLKAEMSAPEFPEPGLYLLGRPRGGRALVFRYPPAGARPADAPSADAGDRLWARAEALLPQDFLPLMVGGAAALAKDAPPDAAAEIARRVSSWTKAQEYKLAEDMAGLYAESFQYYEPGRAPLSIERRDFKAALESESRAAGEVTLAVSDPLVMVDPEARNRAWAVFTLKYDSKIRHDAGLRTLIFERSPFGGQWLIVAELWLKDDGLGE